MSSQGKAIRPGLRDENFLITESVGGPHAIVERTVTVGSVPLPETDIAEVDRIQISEKVIPLPTNKGTSR
jgi:hypothetical protein